MNTESEFTKGQEVWVKSKVKSTRTNDLGDIFIGFKALCDEKWTYVAEDSVYTTEQILQEYGALAPQPITPLFTITLPLPDRQLSPNARVHHMKRAALKKKARAYARRESSQQLLTTVYTLPSTPTHYSINWNYKGIKPDSDNCLASCKAYLDGIADFLGVNDRDLDVLSITRTHNKQQPHLAITYFAETSNQ